MTEIIETLNSTYEVDWDAVCVRRVFGTNERTAYQSADGDWQRATWIDVIPVYGGHVLRMAWDAERATVSSLIRARREGKL